MMQKVLRIWLFVYLFCNWEVQEPILEVLPGEHNKTGFIINEMDFGRKIKDPVTSSQHSGGSGNAQAAEWALPELRLSFGWV